MMNDLVIAWKDAWCLCIINLHIDALNIQLCSTFSRLTNFIYDHNAHISNILFVSIDHESYL